MNLIVGLGNPGKQYADTRHNVGFYVLDKLLFRFSVSPHVSRKLSAIYYSSRNVILAKPQTFMNESGLAVKKLMSYFKVDLDGLVVIHDDIDLGIGTYKIQKGRGSAGHKGVLSIINNLKSQDFTRIRIGVGRPVPGIDPERYVLQKFRAEERDILAEMVEEVVKEVEKILTR